MVHMYYAIHELNIRFHTLSFYGTDLTLRSEGTWTIDADADLGSFKNFLAGENKWEVEEFTPENGIDVEKTVSNIIKRIDSNITYYYRDHIKDKPNVDNCVTALKETYVRKEQAW
ncbi:hypothetical protein AGMMS50267_06300 [Spirochaetia bacterium]|nr:hypothetical protein AGMMS50267_06300 [Spirochaetia bacterium]